MSLTSKRRVDWHEAASCAFQIELKDYSHIQERNLPVAKISDGVYYINKETFHIQIIVTKELSPEDNLYLHCLTDNLQDTALVNRLTDDYRLHQEQEIYIKYLHQVSTANFKKRKETRLWFVKDF